MSHPHYRELGIDELKLVQPRMEHAQASLLWVSTLDVVQYMGADFPSPSLEGEHKRLEEIIASTDEYSWMMECDGKIIGNVCINSIEETSKKLGKKAGNLTILIGDKDYWRKGLGLKACSAVIDWALKEGTFDALGARALQENAASIKMLEKLGFEEIGTEPYEGLVHGKPSMWRNFVKNIY